MPRREGQFLVEDFYVNEGGLNTADSPFVVQPSQSTGGKNYDYTKRGGLKKRSGNQKLNTVADTELRSLGLGLWDKPGSIREVIRAAGTKLQRFEASGPTFTNITLDTLAASSSILPGSSETPVEFAMFNTPTSGVLWAAGAGLSHLYGVYSATKATQNGADAPGGSISTSVGGTTGTFASTGTYRYAVALRKASTGVLSNASFSQSAVVAATNNVVTITLTSISAFDTTKYDQFYIYRSAVGGSADFTTGDLIATITTASTTYADTGTSIASSQNVPRASNLVLDNSVLPSGAYNTVTTFKRRLVTANQSTVYLSDLNKPESWPTINAITIPSGGDITGLAIISFTTPYNSAIDELLCIFKQRELWIITGNDLTDWELKFIDNSGCPNQALIVGANGYLSWISYRGVFMWDGAGKPKYASQSIEDKFARGGDIDKSKLAFGWGEFSQARNEIQWRLSSSIEGEQKYVLKMDLRLTGNAGQDAIGTGLINGVFTPDVTSFPSYAGLVYLPGSTSSEETFVVGDDSGFLYSAYLGLSDGDDDIEFEYITPYHNMGSPNLAKRYHKVVLWLLDSGSFDVTLNFWSDYRFKAADMSSIALEVSANNEGSSLLWDVGEWDVNYWDTSANKVKALVFNLNSVINNTEGDCIRLSFTQTGSAETLTIFGYSVYFTELPLRK